MDELKERALQVIRDHLACVMADIIEPLFELEHREIMKALGDTSL